MNRLLRLALLALALCPLGVPASPLYSDFSVGVGDRITWDNPVGSWDYSNLQRTADLLQQHGITAAQARYLVIWMVPGWQESWFPATEVQAQVIDRGFIPVFVHWWFGDDTRPATILSKEADYYADLVRVGDYLKQLSGTALLVLEPEFNTDPSDEVNSWAGFSTVLLNGRSTVEGRIAGSGISLLYGTAPGTWDSAADLAPALDGFAAVADFLGVQSMYASTYHTASETLAGPDLALARLTEYHQRYGKPTFLPYFVISSYDQASGDPAGWNGVQAQAIDRFHALCPRLYAEAGTFGIAYMMLADDPNHHGFFGEAEYHFGLMDRYFGVKPGFDALFSDWACTPSRLDTDGDGFTDAIELDAGSDPKDPTSVPPGDVDGDGIPNGVDPQPWAAAGGDCVEISGRVAIANRLYTGTAACSATDAILTGTGVQVGTPTAAADLVYRAGGYIRLFPGFQATAGSRFQALIGPP